MRGCPRLRQRLCDEIRHVSAAVAGDVTLEATNQEMVDTARELKIPFTMFLTDSVIRSDYGYFKKLQALGDGVQNHTLTHPNLRTLGAAAQKQEICGQQTKLKDRYGTAPRLFRPPYGNWNENTRAASSVIHPSQAR